MIIPCIEVGVFLGCWPGELDQEQIVQFKIEIDIQSEYKASRSDQLQDSIDYSKIVELINKIALQTKYNLLEHLTNEAFNAVLDFLKEQRVQGVLTVAGKKNKIDILNIKNGVEFQCQSSISL